MVTAATPGVAAVTTLTPGELRAAFGDGRIEPVRITAAYGLALVLVVIATLLLPVLYLTLPGLIAWLVYWHAVSNADILSGAGARFWRLVAYLAPIVAGSVVVFFLFKPILARAARRPSLVVLDEREHPLFFEFLRCICRSVGAPVPVEVVADCKVNASASLRRGLASVVAGDLRLTVGLPLVAGLSLRQFAGVLAHEMGHFAQGSGMRLTYLVRAVNAWLARVVYERDEWDERLADWTRSADLRIAIVLVVARAGVWLSRKVLWLLLVTAHAIGSWMLRQMEYDADRYEARLVGSDAFASTTARMRVLSAASARATAVLSESYQVRRLADDFVELTAASASRLSADVLKALAEPAESEGRASLFDTHPPDSARVASAEREGAPGLLRLEAPASAVFPDLATVSRRTTETFYREEHDIAIEGVRLVPVTEILARDAEEANAEVARERVFGALASVTRPLHLGKASAGEMSVTTPEAASAARANAVRLADEARLVSAKLVEAQHLMMSVEAANALFEVSTNVDAALLGNLGTDQAAAEAALERARADRTATEATIAPAREALAVRVRTALAILASPTSAIPDAAIRAAEAASIVEALDGLAAHAETVATLLDAHVALTYLFRAELSTEEDLQRRERAALARLDSLRLVLRRLVLPLQNVKYPFDDLGGGTSLAAFATLDLQADENPMSAFEHAGLILSRLYAFYARGTRRLSVTVEEVERSCGADSRPPELAPLVPH